LLYYYRACFNEVVHHIHFLFAIEVYKFTTAYTIIYEIVYNPDYSMLSANVNYWEAQPEIITHTPYF